MLDDLSHRPPRAPIRIIADPKDAYLNQAVIDLTGRVCFLLGSNEDLLHGRPRTAWNPRGGSAPDLTVGAHHAHRSAEMGWA